MVMKNLSQHDGWRHREAAAALTEQSPAGAFLIVLLLAFALLSPVSPAAAEEPPVFYPEVAGTTVIHGEGIVGITMMLPEPIKIFTSNLTIQAGQATKYVWTGFRSHSEADDALCDFCIRNSSRLFPGTPFPPVFGSCSDDQGNEVGCAFEARPIELYFVTDGPATLTFRVPELSGSTELTATAQVDGHFEELLVTGCSPLPDCSQGYAYGGKSRTIGLGGRPAMAGVTGYLVDSGGVNGVINPGLEDMEVCAFPGNFAPPGASPDPVDHPTGCDDDLTPGPVDGGEFTLRSDGYSETHSQQYLGFKVFNRRTLAPATFRVWGRWLEAGMTCASGDFHDCMN